MGSWTLVTLALTALVTSIISAILGMGGGVMLLAVMLCFMSHGEAIPTHAAVQIASNGTRVWTLYKHVDVKAFGQFVVGVVPGAGVGLMVLWLLGEPQKSEPFLKTLIGAYILLATFALRKNRPVRSKGAWWDFSLFGMFAGVAALTVGAVGPLIAPVFARNDFPKERLIATKAMCQLSTHVLKIPAFILLRDLDVHRLGSLALLMAVMVIPGTLLGRKILVGIQERHFQIAFRCALAVSGFKIMIIDGLTKWPLWQ